MTHIAIIGAGFSGTMLAINLINKATLPFQLTLIEKSGTLAKGIAYGTKDPYHLLNVTAKKMGAFAENESHFYQWIEKYPELWRNLDPAFEGLNISPYQYVPRMIYGAYLTFLWKEAQQLAQEKKILLKIDQQEVTDISTEKNQLTLHFESGQKELADQVILAVGVPQNKSIALETKEGIHPHYISNIRNITPQVILEALEAKRVALIGTGLTMLDIFLSLTQRNFKGEIVAISSSGKLPEPHADPLKPYNLTLIDSKHPPRKVLSLFKVIRQEIKKGAKEGFDWRDVLNAFRPITIELWQQMSWEERKKSLRLLDIWNHHRHRAPKMGIQEIKRWEKEGRFKMLKGKVTSIEMINKKSLAVKYAKNKIPQKFETDFIFNCCGPQMDLKKNSSPLLQKLLTKRFILQDPLATGIQVTPEYNVKGKVSGNLYAIGILLFGERFETIAVPELRVQCSDLAKKLLNIQ